MSVNMTLPPAEAIAGLASSRRDAAGQAERLSITVRVELGPALTILDDMLRRLSGRVMSRTLPSGRPPAHYNPLPKFGLRCP